MSEPKDVLEELSSRLGRIEAAIHQYHREVLERMTDIQKQIDTDVASLTQVLADFAGEWQQMSQRLAMEAPQIDTSKLDALAGQAQAMDAAWKAQLAPAAAPGTATGTAGDAGSGTSATAAPSGPSATPDAGSASPPAAELASAPTTTTTGSTGTA